MAGVGQSAYETFRGGTEIDIMDMDDKIKGAHLRGKKYTVSQDGLCPRCGNSNRLYVILDKLFPMGDMPEILHTLIAKGRAILWSSQEKEGYWDPPTFLCRGFCPSDPLGAGFNVNWGNVSLNQILESLDKPIQKAIIPVSSPEESRIQDEGSNQDESSDNPMQVLDEFRGEKSDDERNTTETSAMQSSSDKEEETEDDDDDDNDEEEDDDDDELDEEELIKQMLAKEQQKLSQENNDDDDADDNVASSAPSDLENFSEQSDNVISSTVTVTASTTETVLSSTSTTSKTVSLTAGGYPVSSTGRCPYCGASDVKYIIVVSESTKDTELPQSLQQLLKSDHAFKMAKGDSEPPSFQCQKCQYGFNLNWSKTNLEVIFGLPPATSSPSTTTSASYTSTASMSYQTPPPAYMPHAAYQPYPRPSVLPPRYPPPVGVPPPVAYHGYPPTYPSYYGSYYPPLPIPPPVGSYPPYSPVPRIPPPGIPPPGIRPPGIPPPGIPPPGIHPPGIHPPGIPPPVIPPPGIPPPRIPPPGIAPPGYPTPAVSPILRTPAGAWGSYPYTRPMYRTPPHYPRPPSAGYLPPPGGRPYYPPPQRHVRPPIRPRVPRPWYQPPVRTGMPAAAAAGVPTQQESSAEQAVGGENSKVAAARFEMVLNQIDIAQARVRHEKELMKEFHNEVYGTTATDSKVYYQQNNEEPNALTDDGQKMPEYEEKPPGEEDTGFDSSVIITTPSEPEKIADSSVNTAAAEHSVSSSEPMAVDIIEDQDVTARENDAETSNVVVSANQDSKKDLNDDDVNDLPEAVKKIPKKTVPIRGGRSTRSKKQDKLLSAPAAAATRQTRRSRRSEPATSTEETDSTAAEEEAAAGTARSRRSRKTKPPSRGVKRLDIGDVQDKEEQGGLEVSDTEMGESSDVLSQSSAVPHTESDSQELPSESLPSSSEAETVPAASCAIARPLRGRATRGRKRKQESLENEAVVSGPPARKSRRGEVGGLMTEEPHSAENEKDEDEKMLVNNPVGISQEEDEDTEMATTSPRVGRSRKAPIDRDISQPTREAESTVEDTNLDQDVEDSSTTVTQAPDKPVTEIRTSRRQTRKSAQIPQETETAVSAASETEESTVTMQEDDTPEADKTTSNRRTRRSAPRNVSPATDKTASHRQTRKSLEMRSQESDMSDSEQHINNNEISESDVPGDDNKPTDSQQSLIIEQKEITSDTLQGSERKTNRRTRNTRISSASSEDASVSTRVDEITPNTSQGDEGKTNRRTRKTRISSASSEDALVSTRVDVQSTQESDTLMTTEEVTSNRQTRSRKSPAFHKLGATMSDTSAAEDAESTPQTRKSRRSLPTSNEDTTMADVQLPVEPDTPDDSVSSRRTRKNKSTPTAQEATEQSQESDYWTVEEEIEEEDSITPQRRASRKIALMESTASVTKRITRNRQKK